jgi:hypothetical protein
MACSKKDLENDTFKQKKKNQYAHHEVKIRIKGKNAMTTFTNLINSNL